LTDALGTRAVLAVLVPSTNTMVEPDLASLQPPGVTNHTFRFHFPELPASPERLLALMEPAIATWCLVIRRNTCRRRRR
jgi:maleate cis-trans isomerase